MSRDSENTFVLWTRRNLVIFFSVFFSFSGLILGNTPILLMGLLFAYMGASAAWIAGQSCRGLSIERTHPRRIFENENLMVEYAFRSNANIPVSLLEIRDTIPLSDRFFYRMLLPERLRRSETIRLKSRIPCVRVRGAFTLGPIEIIGGDPAGIVRGPIIPIKEDEMQVLVCPSGHNIENLNLLSEGLLQNIGLQTREKPGESGEFTGLREYRPGDPVRRIHWRSSLRHDKLLVREFLTDITTDVHIFADIRRLSRYGTGEHSTLEYVLKCAAHLACTAAERAHRFGASFVGDENAEFPLGAGNMHLLTLLDRMVNIKARSDADPAEWLIAHNRDIKSGATVALIVSSVNTNFEALRPIFQDWQERNVGALAVLVDDRSFMKIFREQDDMMKSAPPLREQVSMLYKLNATVFTLSKHDDISAKLNRPEIQAIS